MLYIKSLTLENVKCFGKKQTIDFTQGKDKIAQWTVILGDNGAGKTTVLRSLVAMLPEPQSYIASQKHPPSILRWSNSNLWVDILRKGAGYSKFDLRLSELADFKHIGSQPIDLGFVIRDTDGLVIQLLEYDFFLEDRTFCFSYGASRKMAKRSISDEIVEDVSRTLFDEEAVLQNSEEYLLRLAFEDASKNGKSKNEVQKVKDLLLKVLPSGVKDIRVEETARLQWQVQVQTPYGWVPMKELSLGYKTTIAWLIDFATKMIYFHEKSENPFAEPAILIIDEIDLHMHPAWQREIIEELTKLFPKTQFIVTAHSPLIAQAALDANIVVLKREGDEVIVHNDPAIVRSWRIDQVLTSDLFGLKEARPKGIEEKMKRRRALLKKGERITEKERAELDRINQEIDAMPIGEGPVQMDAVDVLNDFADKLAAYKASKAV